MSKPSVKIVPLTLKMAPEVFALMDDSRKYLEEYDEPNIRLYQSVEDLESEIKQSKDRQYKPYAIFHNESEVVGCISLEVTPTSTMLYEMTYWIGHKYTERGNATAAAATLIKEARYLEYVGGIVVYTNPNNLVAQRVALANGFIEQAPAHPEYWSADLQVPYPQRTSQY